MKAVQLDIRSQCKPDSWFSNNCTLPFERSVHVVNVPKPVLEPSLRGYALIRNLAASLNPADWEMTFGGMNHGRIFGLESSGVVEEITEGCDLNVGDHVWAGVANGGAEYVIGPCSRMGKKPASLTDVEAAAVPIAAMTDLHALKKLGAPWTDKPSILITAAAGGCGLFAVQLARALGAGEIITTSSPNHFHLLKEIGADRTLDYHESDWWDALGTRSVDKIYDIVPMRASADHALEVLKDEGDYLQLDAGPVVLFDDRAKAKGKCKFDNTVARALRGDVDTLEKCTSTERPGVSLMNWIMVAFDRADLDFLSKLVENGQLKVVLDSVYTRDNITEAFARSRTGHATGKIVMRHY